MEHFVSVDVWTAVGFLVLMLVISVGSIQFTLVEVGRVLREEDHESPQVRG